MDYLGNHVKVSTTLVVSNGARLIQFRIAKRGSHAAPTVFELSETDFEHIVSAVRGALYAGANA